MRLPNLYLTLLIFTLAATSSVWNVTVQAADPKPNVELRVTVGNKIVNLKKDLIPIKIGKSLQLKIEKIRPDGTVVDVTNSEFTIYYPVPDVIGGRYAPSFTKTGLVTVTIVREDQPSVDGFPIADNIIQAIILHGSGVQGAPDYEYGFIAVVFEIQDK